MDSSRILINLVGGVSALFAWFDPLSIGLPLRVAIFIISFDMMGILTKALFFTAGFLYPAFGSAFGNFSWTLLVMLGAELFVTVLDIQRQYFLVAKPAAVFFVSYVALGLQPSLVIAGADLVINLTRRYLPRKRKPGVRKS
jgi:hypothetical protein